MSYDEQDWNRPVMGSGARDTVRERRSTIENNDGVVDRTLYPIQYSSAIYKGKFFTRGCRGMLESIQVYCDGDAVDTLTIRYSPHPCLGPFGEVSIIPADGYAWQDFPVEGMWNYDSLFIWIHACTANITWGYDAAVPYDGHESADAGATWADMAIRPFIRVVYTGETPGDVPVSGIINTIEIPSVAAAWESDGTVNVPHHTITTIVDIAGAGTMLEAALTFYTSVPPTAGLPPAAVWYGVYIYADGTLAYYTNNRQLTQSEILTSGRCAIGDFRQTTVADPAYDRTALNAQIPLKFRRSLRIRAQQTTGAAVNVHGSIYANRLV